jgi:lysozyme
VEESVRKVASLVVLCAALGSVSVARADDARGVDVSQYEGTIDWATVAKSGISFGIARVSDGMTHDPTFARNWAGMKANGIVRGAYQFFRPRHPGAQQADDFLDQFTLEAGDLPPTLDVEVTDGQSSTTIAAEIADWVAEVEKRTGRTPMIYASPGLWKDFGQRSSDGCDLWVAHWGVSAPTLPTGWSRWTIWQYQNDGHVPGIAGNVDLDRFNGTTADLQTYALQDGLPLPAGTVAAVSTASAGGSVASTPAPAPAPVAGTTGLAGALGKISASVDHPLLGNGSRGASVVTLQKLLDASSGALAEDGIFGPKTEAAVRAFQAAHGCKVDGIVGPETWAALTGTP